MARARTAGPLGPNGECPQCEQQHLTGSGKVACRGHKRTGAPCVKSPMTGQDVCGTHGGRAPQAVAAAERKMAEQRAEVAVRKLIPDDLAPVTDPIAVLARLAGEADAIRAAVAHHVNELTSVVDPDDVTSVHAYVTLYERFLDRTVRICEALVRSNYLERHAAVEEAEAVALLAAVQGGLRLIDDPTLRQAVTVAISDGVRALAG